MALATRVSTSDKEQDPDTQLMPMRDEIYDEYIDHPPANDLAHRVRWRDLLDDAAKCKFSFVLVSRLDRAFRSVMPMHDTLAVWDLVGVSFMSLNEQFDTSTALGRLLFNLLASLAEFELELIRERVKAGMDRARRQGKRIGRPTVCRTGEDSNAVLELFRSALAKKISPSAAAKELGIGYSTLKRQLDAPSEDLSQEKEWIWKTGPT